MRLVDVSVAAKWFVAEADSARAVALIGQEIAAPDFLLIELTNVLWKKVLAGMALPLQASIGIAEAEMYVEVIPTRGFEPRALEIALELGHSVYDCLYLATAEAIAAPLITADDRLIRRCVGTRFAALIEPLA